MRKLIESSLVSLDGVVGAPERLAPHWDDENKRHALSELAEYDAFLLGRVTYELFSSRWSGIRGDPYYDAINRLPKYVASSTLRETTWNATLIQGDLAVAVSKLKQQPGKNLIKYGTSNLDRTLIQHRLIDEFRFSIFPVVLGSGRRLFDGIDIHQLSLRLTDTKIFANGIVRLTYVPTYG
jgi:dihydrofolate reductase